MSEKSEQMLSFPQIKSSEIQMKNFVLGRGAFGLVEKAKWNDRCVAVKIYKTEEKNQEDFKLEFKQLSRVSHQNIVQLFGFVEEVNFLALVIEYAEGGSLYDVLNSKPGVSYSLWHAMSWLLQCAQGISYMHSMKPKALLHRDLKSLNLLLGKGGTDLKICDFNTVCDLRTIMTISKGSIGWMAPEVFKTNKYSEKCDIYSWAIILWELLSRKTPWEQLEQFPIMWLVGNGERPPLLYDCPKLIETLMTKCWSQDPNERPSMREVELTVEQIIYFCPKPDCEQILVSNQNEEDSPSANYTRLDIQIATYLSVMQINENETKDQERVPLIGRSHSDSEVYDGVAKQIEYIKATEPLSEDFQKFKTNLAKESEMRTHYTECQPLIPIFEKQKTLLKDYLQMKSQLMVLLSQKQNLDKSDPIVDKQRTVKCLEEEKCSLEELKNSLITRLDLIKQNHQKKEDKANGWYFVDT